MEEGKGILPIPMVLKREPKRKNIVIGKDPKQIEFLQREITTHHNYVDIDISLKNITDEDILLCDRNKIWVVDSLSKINISRDTQKKLDIWINRPIEAGSAALNCIIQQAYCDLGFQKPTKEDLKAIGEHHYFLKTDDDITGLYFACLHLVLERSRGISPPIKDYTQPWEKPWRWVPSGQLATMKLNYLNKLLIWYTYASEDQWLKATSTGCSVSVFKRLKSLDLDIYAIKNTLRALSQWRSGLKSDEQTLLIVGLIWAS